MQQIESELHKLVATTLGKRKATGDLQEFDRRVEEFERRVEEEMNDGCTFLHEDINAFEIVMSNNAFIVQILRMNRIRTLLSWYHHRGKKPNQGNALNGLWPFLRSDMRIKTIKSIKSLSGSPLVHTCKLERINKDLNILLIDWNKVARGKDNLVSDHLGGLFEQVEKCGKNIVKEVQNLKDKSSPIARLSVTLFSTPNGNR
ncbi:hypothetical protein TREMEDRAFT_58111 [Tremella mesenterica DSM 1558]|uniref:uncharacterized protein n=1 Tax=Tremella mesenterica (strain ATCC 24925 / CBS 8224 / DSM 1558 / NBRC 9311 / NRRL Y-6157 / RJB 2259-6 / UBC 559-6) TaxID=578456 RepID=UPI0003F49373|nr:uncharacterized protein TREMEDRAFT_58111 [Tremella mesenterica DSM 1558]EIW71968.1 hypothetical protein TREMEDRAFT_58111 [Tremella mesenterica DSM 1558]